jgi:hypothetical protein
MDKFKEIMNDWNYYASCGTLTSLQVSDLDFKLLIFVALNVLLQDYGRLMKGQL